MTTEPTGFSDIPAHEFPELLDIIIWNMSGHHPVEEWRGPNCRPGRTSTARTCSVPLPSVTTTLPLNVRRNPLPHKRERSRMTSRLMPAQRDLADLSPSL